MVCPGRGEETGMYYDNNILRKDKMAGGAIANVSCVTTGEDRAPEEIRRCEGETQRVVESG